MNDEKSFLKIDNYNKEELLMMRKILFNSLMRNANKEERKGMYLVSLAIFTEFERLTRHIIDPEIVKS